MHARTVTLTSHCLQMLRELDLMIENTMGIITPIWQQVWDLLPVISFKRSNDLTFIQLKDSCFFDHCFV